MSEVLELIAVVGASAHVRSNARVGTGATLLPICFAQLRVLSTYLCNDLPINRTLVCCKTRLRTGFC